MEENLTDSTQVVGHMTLKIPPFFNANAEAWFCVVEGQFALAKITTPATQFYHALCSLPPEIIARFPPEILNSKSYVSLKTEVLSRCEETKPELFDKLIAETVIAGRPSDQLHELLRIATKLGVSNELVRHRFLQSVDKSIAPILAAQTSLTLSQLGKMADDLIPFIESKNTCNFVTNTRHVKSQVTTPVRHSSDVIRPFSAGQRPKICRSHIYFADKAKYCKPWCKYPNKPSNIQMQQSSRANSPTPSN